MKWIALLILAAGFLLMVDAKRRDATSGFENGTFLLQIAEAVGGVCCLFIGTMWLAVLLFMGI